MEAQEAVGAVRSTLTEEALRPVAGPTLPAKSVTEAKARPRMTVPSEQEATVTVKYEPDEDEGEKEQPVAVPVLEKSAELRPEMLSEKVRM